MGANESIEEKPSLSLLTPETRIIAELLKKFSDMAFSVIDAKDGNKYRIALGENDTVQVIIGNNQLAIEAYGGRFRLNAASMAEITRRDSLNATKLRSAPEIEEKRATAGLSGLPAIDYAAVNRFMNAPKAARSGTESSQENPHVAARRAITGIFEKYVRDIYFDYLTGEKDEKVVRAILMPVPLSVVNNCIRLAGESGFSVSQIKIFCNYKLNGIFGEDVALFLTAILKNLGLEKIIDDVKKSDDSAGMASTGPYALLFSPHERELIIVNRSAVKKNEDKV